MFHRQKHYKQIKFNKFNLGKSIFFNNIIRSSRPEVFCKTGVLRNFAKFTGKHLCQTLFFNKVAGLRPVTLLKKREFGTGVFLWILWNFYENTFIYRKTLSDLIPLKYVQNENQNTGENLRVYTKNWNSGNRSSLTFLAFLLLVKW